MEHHDLRGGTPKTFAASICEADVGETSTTVLSLICRNTGTAAWLLLVFVKTDQQPAPPSSPHLVPKYAHEYSVITAVARMLVGLA